MTDLFDTDDQKVKDTSLRKLDEDLIAWFTTIGKDGTPRAVPVWFFWENERIYVLSEPDTGKVAHVKRGSPVLVHLEGGAFGNEIVILHGTAEVSPQSTREWIDVRREPYLAKYSAAIEDYGTGLDALAEQFSTLLVFTPHRIQAW